MTEVRPQGREERLRDRLGSDFNPAELNCFSAIRAYKDQL